MFKKRVKKTYPPGTFIPTAARVCAIIQLCLAFTVLLWNLSEPFSGELFATKSKLILIEDVIGVNSPIIEKQERLQRNAQVFKQLPLNDQQEILNGLETLNNQLKRTFFQKLTRSLHILLYEMPRFEQFWLFLSFILPILLLKKIEGAKYAIWLLPLLAALYGLDNRLYASPKIPSADEQFFPSEQLLIEKYSDTPLKGSINEQQAILQSAWHRYLVDIWAQKNTTETFETKIEQGELAFNIARVKHQIKSQSLEIIPQKSRQEPLLFLACYFFWNLFFAVKAGYKDQSPQNIREWQPN